MPRLVCCCQEHEKQRPLLTSPTPRLAWSATGLSDERSEQRGHPQWHFLPNQILNTPRLVHYQWQYFFTNITTLFIIELINQIALN